MADQSGLKVGDRVTLVGAAITLTALYLAERRWGVRRVIPAALATLATAALWLDSHPWLADLTKDTP